MDDLSRISERLAAARANVERISTQKPIAYGPSDPMAVDRSPKTAPNGYRKATALETAMSSLSKTGEAISDVFGFGEKSQATRERILQENPDTPEWELFLRSTFENLPSFAGNLPGMMIGAIPTGIAKGYEAATGKPVTEIQDGYIPIGDLDTGQRIAAGLDAAIDTLGVAAGGTGAALRGGKALLTGGKVTAKTTARAAARMTKQADELEAAGKIAKAAEIRKRVDEIKSGSGLSLGEALKEAKMFSTGNTAADIALETLEEGGEEFAQSIFEDLRGNKDGHAEWWSDDWDLTKALESAALGALGGGIMSGGMHGISYAATKFDEKFKPTSTKPSSANPVNSAVDYNFAQKTDGTLAIPGQSEEVNSMVQEAEKYSSAVLDYGRTNASIGVDDSQLGLVDLMNMAIKENRVADQNKRYFLGWLQSGNFSITVGNQQVTSDNFIDACNLALSEARNGNTANLDTLFSGLDAFIRQQYAAGNAFQLVLTKNPGGAIGYVRSSLSGLCGIDPQILIHQMTATLLNADFDSDMYAAIAYQAVKDGSGITAQNQQAAGDTRTTSQQWQTGGSLAWKKDNWHHLGLDSYKNNEIRDWFVSRYQQIEQNINSGLSRDQFQTAIDWIIQIANGRDVKEVIGDGTVPGLVTDQALISFIRENQNIWAFMQVAGNSPNSTTNILAPDFFSLFGDPSNPQRVIGGAANAQALAQANTAPSQNPAAQRQTMLDNEIVKKAQTRPSMMQDAQVSSNATRGLDQWSWAKIDLFQAATTGTNRSKCRELLQLYFSLRGVIYDSTVAENDNASYVDIVRRAVMNNLRLEGPGENPYDMPVTTMQYYCALVTIEQTDLLAAEQQVSKGTKKYYDIMKDAFRESRKTIKKEYSSILKSKNPNITDRDIDMMMPDVKPDNADHELLKTFQDIRVSRVFPGYTGNQTFSELTSSVINNLGRGKNREAGLEDNLRSYINGTVFNSSFDKNIPADVKRETLDILYDLCKSCAVLKHQDAVALRGAIKAANGSLSLSSKAINALNELREKAKNSNTPIMIDFSDLNTFSPQDVATVAEYAGWLNGILGKKVLSNLGWHSVESIFSDGDKVKYKIVNGFLSMDDAAVENAVVTAKIISNTFRLRDLLVQYKQQQRQDVMDQIKENAAKISEISPFYSRLIDYTLPGFNGNNLALTSGNIDRAIEIFDKLYDADISLATKESIAADVISYYPNVIDSRQDAFSTFVADAFASEFDQQDITSVSSNIRKSEHFVKDMNAFSSNSLQNAAASFESALGMYNFNQIMSYIQQEAELRGYQMDTTLFAQAAYFNDIRPTKNTIDKTAAHAFAEGIQKNNAIANGYGYVNDEMDSLNYISSAPEPISHLIRTPQMFSRMMLTDFIGKRGGISILGTDSKVYTFHTQAEFLTFLSGLQVRETNGKAEITQSVVSAILKNVPEAVYAFVPSSVSFSQTPSGDLQTNCNVSPDFAGTFKELQNKYGDNTNTIFLKQRMRNKLMDTVCSDEKYLSSFWYLYKNYNDKLKDFDQECADIDSFIDALLEDAISYKESSHKKEFLARMYASSDEAAMQTLREIKETESIDFLSAIERNVEELSQGDLSMLRAAVGDIIDLVRHREDLMRSLNLPQNTSTSNINDTDIRDFLFNRIGVSAENNIVSSMFLLRLRGVLDGSSEFQAETTRLNTEVARNFVQGIINQEFSDVDDRALAMKLAEGYVDMVSSPSSAQNETLRFNWHMFDNMTEETVDQIAKSIFSLNQGPYWTQFFNLISLAHDNSDITRALSVVNFLKESYAQTDHKKSRWKETEFLPAIEKQLTGNPPQALSEKQIIRLIHFFIHDTTSIDDSRLDLRASYAHYDSIENLFDTLAKDSDFNVDALPAKDVPNLNFPKPTMVTAEYASDLADQTLRGYIPSLTSGQASERYNNVVGFLSMPNDIGFPTDAEVQQAFATNQTTTFTGTQTSIKERWDNFYLKDQISRYRNGEAIGFYYVPGDLTPKPITTQMLESGRFPQGPVVAYTVFDDNTGLDAKYFGLNQRDDQGFNPTKRTLRKLIIGVEGKALKAAKQAGLHPYASYTELSAEERRGAGDLILAGQNPTVSDICDKVKAAKEALVTTVYSIYSDQKASREENLALDLSPTDLLAWSNLIHQYVNINFAEPVTVNDIKIDHVPVSLQMLMNAKNAGVNDLRAMGYMVTVDNQGTQLPLADILNAARIRDVEVVRTSFHQLNDVLFKRQLQIHRALNPGQNNGEFDLRGTWHEEFRRAANELKSGSLLYNFEHLNIDEARKSFQRDIAYSRFKLDGYKRSTLNAEGGLGRYSSIQDEKKVEADLRDRQAAETIIDGLRDKYKKDKYFVVHDFSQYKNARIPSIDDKTYEAAGRFEHNDAVIVDVLNIKTAITSITGKGSDAPKYLLVKQGSSQPVENTLSLLYRNKYRFVEDGYRIGTEIYRVYYFDPGTQGKYQYTISGVREENPERNVVRVSFKNLRGDPGVYATKQTGQYFLSNTRRNVRVPVSKPAGDIVELASWGEIVSHMNDPEHGIAVSDDPNEIAAVEYVKSLFANRANQSTFINNYFNSFQNGGGVQCLGFWKVLDSDGSIQYLSPIIAKTNSGSAKFLIADLQAEKPYVDVAEEFVIQGTPRREKSGKGASPEAGVKEMLGTIDPAYQGVFALNVPNTVPWYNDFIVQSKDESEGKTSLWPRRIWSYWRWMRMNKLSMFSSADSSFDDTIVKHWDWPDRAKFFGKNKNELEEIRQRLEDGSLVFHDRSGAENAAFNKAMTRAFSSFVDHRSSGHTVMSIFSGLNYDVTYDNNGQASAVAYSTPPYFDMWLLYGTRLSEADMQIIYNQISPDHYAPLSGGTGQETWNRNGEMYVGHGTANGAISYNYEMATIDAEYIDMGKTTDHITNNTVALGNKLQAMAALDGDPFADVAALRAEQLSYLGDPSFYSGFIFENNNNGPEYFSSEKRSSNVAARQQRMKTSSEKNLALRRTLKGIKASGQQLFINRQSKRVLDEIIKAKDIIPNIQLNDGTVVRIEDLSQDYRFAPYIDTIRGFFPTKKPSDKLIWEWVCGQLGYYYTADKPNVYENWVTAALQDIVNDIKTLGVPVGFKTSRASTDNDPRYKMPVLSRASLDFIEKNLSMDYKQLWGQGNDLRSTIVALAGTQMPIIKMAKSVSKRTALINMMQAYATESGMSREINTGITLGVDNIDDIIAWANEYSQWMTGDQFFESLEPVMKAQEEMYKKWQDRTRLYQEASMFEIDPDVQGAAVYRKVKDLSSTYTSAINFLTSSTKVMAMAQPLLAPIQAAERFGYGGTTRYLLSNSIAGKASPYKSNVVSLLGKERAMLLSQDIRKAAESSEVRTIIEERRMINLLAEDGFTVNDINQAGGLENFLRLRQDESGRLKRFYNKFMEFQTGKGILSSLQAEVYLTDLVRLLSLSDQANFWFKQDSGQTRTDGKQNITNLSMIENVIAGKQLGQWLYTNAFDPKSPLYEMSNQAFNTSMEGDAARNTVTTIWFSEFCKRRPLAKLFTTTTLCRFPMYAFGITDRVMNTVFPMTTIHYMFAQFAQHAATDERMSKWKIPGLKGLTVGAIDWSNAHVSDSFEEAFAIDLQRFGTFMVATMLLGISGAVEPPDDRDKWGNIDEWLFFGQRVSTKWWFKDLLGPSLSMVATWKAALLGEPRVDIFFKGMLDCVSSNPIVGAQDALEMIFDPYSAYMESYYEDVQRFSKASDGQPDAATVLWANCSTKLMSWGTQFILPSFLRELLNSASEYETSYKDIYQTNAYGDVLTDANGNPKVEKATYYDQKLRQQTRKNPILGFICDLITGSGFAGDKTGYLAWEMPRTVYYDTTQLDTYQRLSIYTTDANGNIIEKAEDAKQSIALEVIYTLMQYSEEEIARMGFAVPYDTLDYVSDVVWDIAYDQMKAYETMKAMGLLDPYVLGDGDGEAGSEILDAITSNAYQMSAFWKDFYYNKLWSDTMKRGLQRYNRYNTTYAVDDNGEVYATGIKRDILSVLAPFDIAPKSGTLGYYQDWATPSAVTGESLQQRALLPVDENVKTPSWDSIGSNGDGTGNSKSYPKYMSSYGYGSGGSGRGGYINIPNVSTPYPRGNNIISPGRPDSGGRPVSGVDLAMMYLRPQFETKGSRQAYRREDI